MEKYRILYLDHAPFIGGGQLALTRHLKNLNKAEFLPYVASNAVNQDWVNSFSKISEFTALSVPKLKVLSLLSVVRFIKICFDLFFLIKKVDPHLTVINSERMLYPSIIVSRLLGVKAVLWLRDFEYNRLIFKIIQPLLSGIICVSNSIRRFYGGHENEKFRVIYVGTEIVSSSGFNEEVLRFREKIKIYPQTTLIGFAGRLVNWKGVDVLLKACSLLEKDSELLKVDWKVVIAGTGAGQFGDTELNLKDYATSNLRSGRVIFLGYYHDMKSFNQSIDILVHPSISPEPFATVVVDAMAAGKIVVASNIGGTPEIIENGKNGFLFSPGDNQALYNLLKDIILNKYPSDRLSNLRKSAIETIALGFTEERVTRASEEYFKEIIKL